TLHSFYQSSLLLCHPFPPFLSSSFSLFFFFFFFQCYRHHRDLHSFPTRRSSDLGHRGVLGPGERFRRQYGQPAGAALAGVAGLRSEEHTSELQSQSNLVCRLLLEKKKKKQRTETHNETKQIES